MNEVELLAMVHNDLSCIASILIFFVVVIILYFMYKFFDMMFKF